MFSYILPLDRTRVAIRISDTNFAYVRYICRNFEILSIARYRLSQNKGNTYTYYVAYAAEEEVPLELLSEHSG